MRKILLIVTILFLGNILWAQQGTDYLKGKVLEHTEDGKEIPLFSANVHWLGTTVGTITDAMVILIYHA